MTKKTLRPVSEAVLSEEFADKFSASECESRSRRHLERLQTFVDDRAARLNSETPPLAQCHGGSQCRNQRTLTS